MNDVAAHRSGTAVLTARLESGVTVVSLIGEHDISTEDEVRDTLAHLLQEGADVVFDLSETVFIECRIVHVLQDSLRLASQHGAGISFQSATLPTVKRVFELIGTLDAWPICQTRAEAITAASRPPASVDDGTKAADGNPEPRTVPARVSSLSRSRVSARDPGDARDGELMDGIVHGNSEDFIRLFERYAPTGMALAHGIVRQRHLAEEAVQEAFLAVWRDPGRYRAERGTVRSWLMSIVHHRVVDLVRREETQRRRTTDVKAAGSAADRLPADPCDVVTEQIGSAEDRKAVRRALEAISSEQRQIIDLMYFGGLSQTRISERLSLPLGTVKSRTLLGMRGLRAALGGLER